MPLSPSIWEGNGGENQGDHGILHTYFPPSKVTDTFLLWLNSWEQLPRRSAPFHSRGRTVSVAAAAPADTPAPHQSGEGSGGAVTVVTTVAVEKRKTSYDNCEGGCDVTFCGLYDEIPGQPKGADVNAVALDGSELRQGRESRECRPRSAGQTAPEQERKDPGKRKHSGANLTGSLSRPEDTGRDPSAWSPPPLGWEL